MRYTRFMAYFLLMASGCQSMSFGEHETALSPRSGGSRSPSPSSSSKGKRPFREEDTAGLLGDVVKQASHRPAGDTHARQSTQPQRVHHLSQLIQIHPSHSEQTTHTAATRPSQFAHTHTARPQVSSPHVAHPPPPHPSGGSSHSHVHEKDRDAVNLGHLVANLHPKGPKPRSRNRKGTEAGKGKGSGNHPNHPTGQWWKKAGGTPRVQRGTGQDYVQAKRYREKIKAKKLESQGKHTDQHPSGPQGKGGGPGSPGAGSQAVS